MSAVPEDAIAAATNPATDLAQLAEIAHQHPALRPIVAANPSAYPDLLDWLAGLGESAVDAALKARGYAPTVAAPPPPPAAVAPAAPFAPAKPGAVSGFDIGILIAAVLLPVVGIAAALVALSAARKRPGGASLLAKLAVGIAVVATLLWGAGITAAVVSASNAAEEQRNAPLCEALAEHDDLLADDGPTILSDELALADAPTEGSQHVAVEYWDAHIDQIDAWHDEWQEIVDAVPRGDDDIAYTVDMISKRLDTAEGLHVVDADMEWFILSSNIDGVRIWSVDNC